MRTKTFTTLAAAALLAASSATAALAQAPDIQASANNASATFDTDGGANPSKTVQTYNSLAPNAGWSAHNHPTGVVHK